jgi:hypothetical protein
MFGAWFQLMQTLAETNLAASRVIGLRMVRLAGGGELGLREAQRMVAEKLSVGVEANTLLLVGGSLHAAAKRYHRAVHENERRLTKGK